MTQTTQSARVAAQGRVSLRSILNDRRFLPVLLICPVLVFFIVWNLVPLLWLTGLSFYDYSLLTGMPPRYVGFDNFLRIFDSTSLWFDLSRTFTFVFVSVSLQTILGVLLGLLFWGSHSLPGRRVALTLLFTPMILTPVAAGTFFRFIYDPTFGVFNSLIRSVTGGTVDFLGNPALAFWSVLAVDVWMWTPFMVLMTLAALGSVPRAELEAAEVDRLPWIKRLRLVVLHHGKFILMLGILLSTIETFKTMDLVYQMTQGGPGAVTRVIGISLYKEAFEGFNMGYSAAMAVIALLVSIALTATFIFVLKIRQKRG